MADASLCGLEAVARALHARRVFPGQWSKALDPEFLEAIASSHRGECWRRRCSIDRN